MREPLFLKQNRHKWREYEENLFEEKSEDMDPDRMAELYIQLTDDLAYSRTFYPRSAIVRYLNGLAARTHLLIYQNKKDKSNRFLSFWTEELPLIYFRAQKYMLYAFLIFTITALMGWLSVMKDPTIANTVFGDEYVEMTITNIQNNDPTGVYKDDDMFSMFMHIAKNNIGVCFKTFVMGIFFSVGTVFILFRNGFMFGAFLGLFQTHNVLSTAWSTVMIHGTLELSAIVIGGAAGMMLGNSFMFPGTHTRIQSLQKGAKDGVKIIIGLIPVFTLAAFLESYITRYSEMPLILKMAIIGLSLAYIVWYYVIFPISINHQIQHERQTPISQKA